MTQIPLYFDYLDTNDRNIKKQNGWDLGYEKYIAYNDDNAESFIPAPLRSNMIRVNSSYKGKYFYPLYAHVEATSCVGHFINDPDTIINIPRKVLKDIKNGKARILLINVYEGHGWLEFEKFFKYKLQGPYNLKKSDIVFLTGNTVKTINGIVNVYFNEWEHILIHHEGLHPDMVRLALENIYSNRLREHKYICLQRRPHMHRLALYAEMYRYKDIGILTMGNGDHELDLLNDITTPELFENIEVNHPKSFKKFIALKDTIPREYDVNLSEENPTSDNNYEKYLDSYLHIVSETFQQNESDRLFFSEKMIKPFVFMQPFVLFGASNSLVTLKDLGYQTFDKWIDESYDTIENDTKRFYAALTSVKHFITKDKIEMHELMMEMVPIFLHNYFNLSNSIKNSEKLLNDLKNAFPD
jgi:hypothetical protein